VGPRYQAMAGLRRVTLSPSRAHSGIAVTRSAPSAAAHSANASASTVKAVSL
jgi:hypothetical protein